MRVTIAKINQAIIKAGYKAEIFKGKDYYYFAGDSVKSCQSTSVMTNSLNSLTIEQWIEELESIVNDG
jgi:hypothetical protein